MTVLTFPQVRLFDGFPFRREFAADEKIHLGTAADNEFPLPADLAVAPCHAVVTRSSPYQVPLLVALAGAPFETRINGRRLSRLKVLRHRDEIALGRASLVFWEVAVSTVAADSQFLNRRCLVCYDPFQVGEEAITCPRCQTADHHKDCWLELSRCARTGCEYPVQEAMRRSLGRRVRFEPLEEESEMVRQKRKCAAGRPRDQGPFRPDDYVAYCPKCRTPFHAECWFLLPQCPKCEYDVATLIREELTSDLSPSLGNAKGAALE